MKQKKEKNKGETKEKEKEGETQRTSKKFRMCHTLFAIGTCEMYNPSLNV